MYQHQHHGRRLRAVILVVLGAILAFRVGTEITLAQGQPSDRVYLPYVTSGSTATQPDNVDFDFDSANTEQIEELTAAIENAGLNIALEPGALTIFHEENGNQRTVMTLYCLDKTCTDVAASDADVGNGLKITISVNGTLSAVIEKVSRRLIVVTLLIDGIVTENIQFRCRNCDINIDIPSGTTTPTATPTPTDPPVEEPTPTPPPTDPPVEEPPVTPTDEPPTPVDSQYWHAPGSHDGLNVHEHGDAPPAWADAFSVANFGHPVKFGGDESTPDENTLKHQAYKGFLMDARDASGVDLYIRYHGMSNPMGRSGPLHSYEIYANDSSGNVSFWQGWNFYGYPEIRSQRMTRRHEVRGVDGFPGRDQFIIAAPDETDYENYLQCEQWYGHGGLWAWDVSITICGATTYFTYDEHLNDPSNMNTWRPTGDLGSTRRLEVSHYGPDNPNVGGANLPFDQWFCVELEPNQNREQGRIPSWNVGSAVDGPTACRDGWLPQYVANTFPKAGVYFETGNTAETTYPVDGVTLPN